MCVRACVFVCACVRMCVSVCYCIAIFLQGLGGERGQKGDTGGPGSRVSTNYFDVAV